MSLKLIVFSWQLLIASPHPSPNICLSFYRVELGDQGKPRWRLIMASGRKNVLRKLLRIPYRRLKAGFSVC